MRLTFQLMFQFPQSNRQFGWRAQLQVRSSRRLACASPESTLQSLSASTSPEATTLVALTFRRQRSLGGCGVYLPAARRLHPKAHSKWTPRHGLWIRRLHGTETQCRLKLHGGRRDRNPAPYNPRQTPRVGLADRPRQQPGDQFAPAPSKTPRNALGVPIKSPPRFTHVRVA